MTASSGNDSRCHLRLPRDTATDAAEITTGNTDGLRIATNSDRAITFQTNTKWATNTATNRRMEINSARVVVTSALSATDSIAHSGTVVGLTNDAILSDVRAPTAGSVTYACVSATAVLPQSKIANLTNDLTNRVLSTDARLSDARDPNTNSVTDASVCTAAAIAQSKISGMENALTSRVLTTDARRPTRETQHQLA